MNGIKSYLKTRNLLLVMGLVLACAKLSISQCTYSSVALDDFEYNTNIPGLVAGTVYHLQPKSYAYRSGTRAIYMNFVNGLASNTLVFSRSYTVCPNAQYRISAWLKLAFGGSSTVTLRVKDSTGLVLSTINNTYPSGGVWTQWSSVITPTNGSITFELIYISGTGGNDLALDDLELEICNPSAYGGIIDLCGTYPAFNLYDSIVFPKDTSSTWMGPSTLANGYLGTFDPATDSNGLYTFTWTNPVVGCPDSIGSVSVAVNPGPIVDLGNDTTLCDGDSLSFNVASPGASYLWQDGSTDSLYTIKSAGIYWVSITDTCSTVIDSITVSYNPMPLVDIGPDTSICQGDTLSLNAFQPGATYLWHNGLTDSVIDVYSQGFKWVDVEIAGCTTRDSMILLNSPLPIVNLGPDQNICTGDSVVLVSTLTNSTFLWDDGSTDSISVVNQTGKYWLQVTTNGCVSSDTMEVNLYAYPQVNLGGDTNVCDGDQIILDASVLNGSYVWSNGFTGPTLNVVTSGSYWVQVTQNGCVSHDSIQIDFHPYPIVDLGQDTILCIGDSILLDASCVGCSYLWQDGSTNSFNNANSVGQYWVDVTQIVCTSSDTITVAFSPKPVVDLGEDTTICENVSYSINLGSSYTDYTWQDGSKNSYYNINGKGIYWAQVINNTGCVNSDTLEVETIPLPYSNIGNDTTLCNDDSITLYASFPGASYVWHDLSTDSFFTVTAEGNYWVNVNNECGTYVDEIFVEYLVSPTVDLGGDTMICNGDFVVFDAGFNGATYLWHDQSTDYKYETDRTESVRVEVSNACGTAMDSAEVVVEYCDCQVFIPNAFTPNGDNLDEEFVPVSNCELRGYSFAIYDRWGKEVFYSNAPEEAWDAQFEGKKVATGVYSYKLMYYLNAQGGKRSPYETVTGMVNVLK